MTWMAASANRIMPDAPIGFDDNTPPDALSGMRPPISVSPDSVSFHPSPSATNPRFSSHIGSALASGAGITEQQLRDLPRYLESTAYTDVEKLVIGYAEAMTRTPAVGDDLAELRRRLAEHLSETQIVELAMTVAWENQRARLNQSLGVRPTGMADGLACAVPERIS